MKFGTRADDVQDSKPFIRALRKGETRVRFLQELGDWIHFREHYTVSGRWFPCTRESSCPGCVSPIESVSRWSRKYATNVVNVQSGLVEVIKIPVTLYNRMLTRYERNGNTVINRDYTLLKNGEGLNTDYDVEQEEKYVRDVSNYQLYDIEQMLQDQYDFVQDTGDDAEPTTNGSVTKLSSVSKTKEVSLEDPPFDSVSDEEEGLLTEDELRKMNAEELQHVADEAKLALPPELLKEGAKEDLLQYLLDNLEQA